MSKWVTKELEKMKTMSRHGVTPHLLSFLENLKDPEDLHDGLDKSMVEVVVHEILWWLDGALDEPFPSPESDGR